MKAVRWTSGDKSGLELHDEPTPNNHEVLVRVHAASLNFCDQAILDDQYGGPPQKTASLYPTVRARSLQLETM